MNHQEQGNKQRDDKSIIIAYSGMDMPDPNDEYEQKQFDAAREDYWDAMMRQLNKSFWREKQA